LGSDEEFKVWMRERVPRFDEASGHSWPLLTHTITVLVDDVDTHFEHAKQLGAAVVIELKYQP
jgi:uncharacterized glyoxalase superfamily protein PhnB